MRHLSSREKCGGRAVKVGRLFDPVTQQRLPGIWWSCLRCDRLFRRVCRPKQVA